MLNPRVLEFGYLGRVGLAAALVLTLAALTATDGAGQLAQAQNRQLEEGEVGDGELQRLFEMAREGQAEKHLPFILVRLKRALANQDLLSFLDLVDPVYFDSQFALLSQSGRPPGEVMGQFACEFFSVCDVSKRYSYNDIVSAEVVKVSPEGGLTGGLVEIGLEIRMWDGQTVYSSIFYNPNTSRLSAAVG